MEKKHVGQHPLHYTSQWDLFCYSRCWFHYIPLNIVVLSTSKQWNIILLFYKVCNSVVFGVKNSTVMKIFLTCAFCLKHRSQQVRLPSQGSAMLIAKSIPSDDCSGPGPATRSHSEVRLLRSDCVSGKGETQGFAFSETKEALATSYSFSANKALWLPLTDRDWKCNRL